jgi:hypothetical protein
MKFSRNRAFSPLLLCMVILFAASCSKSGGGSSSAGMSATINGTAWANSYPVVALAFSGQAGFEIIGAQFKGGDSTALGLEFQGPVVLNKPFSSDTTAFVLSYTDIKGGNQTGYAVLTGGFGKSVVTITSYDSTGHKIGGTFSGVLYNIVTFTDSITITNGKFNTSFTAQ